MKNLLFFAARYSVVSLPPVLTLSPLLIISNSLFQLVWIAVCPFVYTILFSLTCGSFARLAQKGVVEGTFKRDPKEKFYGIRRVYTFCWTAIYYFKPLYWLILNIRPLKLLTFRLFGYKGNIDFTVYPDTWIRDLPLLDFAKGSYISNRATIGTNMCLNDGTILIDRVKIGKNAMVGHLAAIAPGADIGDGAQIGVGAIIGLRTRICQRAEVAPASTINHGARIGAGTKIGTGCNIGVLARIGKNLSIPAYTNIPNGSQIKTQQDVEKHLHLPIAKQKTIRDGASTSSRIPHYPQANVISKSELAIP